MRLEPYSILYNGQNGEMQKNNQNREKIPFVT